jgi:hypothetical protein
LDVEEFVNGEEQGAEGFVPAGERDEEAGKPAGSGAKPAGGADDTAARLAQLEADLKAERRNRKQAERRAKEVEASAREWYDRAQGKKEPSGEPDDKPLSVDLTEAIAANDKAAIRKAMAELGYVSRDELENVVKTTKAQMAHEARLYKEFPDLENEKSPLYERTVAEYQKLVAEDPELKKSPNAVKIAARIAKASMDLEAASGKSRPRSRARNEDTDEDESYGFDGDGDGDGEDEGDEEDEARRRERVRSQQGGRPARGRSDEGESSELTRMQRMVIENFKRAGAPITEDGYRKRASRGVTVHGLPKLPLSKGRR